MIKTKYVGFVLLVLVIVGVLLSRFIQQQVSSTSLIITEHLNPQALTWDGRNFWTAHEPGWEMEDEIKPGHSKYKALIFKHANDQNKTIIGMYESPHNYNIIGLEFINGELWSSSWINRDLGRIYKFKIENNTLQIIGSWDTDVSCHGIVWDGKNIWSAYKLTEPVIVKHKMDENISVAEIFFYNDLRNK